MAGVADRGERNEGELGVILMIHIAVEMSTDYQVTQC